MPCLHCGYPNPGGTATCPRCGTALTPAAPVQLRPGPGPVRSGAVRRDAIPEGLFPRIEAPAPGLSSNGQAILFGVLALWALTYMADLRHPSGLGPGLFHLLNLPFILAGKLLLAQFHSFGLALLGPALGALLAPLLVIGWSLVQGHRLTALGGLWWLGAALMDGVTYLDDLRSQLTAMLDGCSYPSPNRSWEFHLISRQHLLARDAGELGAMAVIVALALAGALLWRRALAGDPADDPAFSRSRRATPLPGRRSQRGPVQEAHRHQLVVDAGVLADGGQGQGHGGVGDGAIGRGHPGLVQGGAEALDAVLHPLALLGQGQVQDPPVPVRQQPLCCQPAATLVVRGDGGDVRVFADEHHRHVAALEQGQAVLQVRAAEDQHRVEPAPVLGDVHRQLDELGGPQLHFPQQRPPDQAEVGGTLVLAGAHPDAQGVLGAPGQLPRHQDHLTLAVGSKMFLYEQK